MEIEIDIEFIDARKKFKNLQDNEWEVIRNIRNELQDIAYKYELKWSNALFYQFVQIFTDKWRRHRAVAQNWYPKVIWKARQNEADNDDEIVHVDELEEKIIIEEEDIHKTVLLFNDYNLWIDFIAWIRTWNELCGTNILDYATTVDFDYFFTKLHCAFLKTELQVVRELK